jgi:hypothetical protein
MNHAPQKERPSLLAGNRTLALFALGGGALYLVAMIAVPLAVGDELPAGAWVGFGILTAIVLGVSTGLAIFLVRSSRAAGSEAPARRAVSMDRAARHVLVVADEGCAGEAVCRPLAELFSAPPEHVFVVAPALVSAVRYLDSDVDGARARAGARLDETISALRAAGVPAGGEVGSESPLEAIADALAVFPADVIVVATPPPDRTNWLERGVVERARELYELPVEHLVVNGSP